MEGIPMTDLYSDHLVHTETGLLHERFKHLQDRDLKPEYQDHRIVKSESSDHAYLVSRVETLTVPFEDADVLADKTCVILCNCDDFFYRCSAGLEVDMNPEDVQHCKHGRKAFKAERAKADEQQTKI